MKAKQARGRATHAMSFVLCLVSWLASACAPRTMAEDVYPGMAEYQGREIERVVFVSPEPFDEDTLAQVIVTEPSHCSFLALPVCIFGLGEQERALDLRTLRSDVIRLEQFYRRSGYFGTRVVPAVEPEQDGDVVVRFVVTRGDAVELDTLVVEGTEPVADPAALKPRLPLQEGDIFDLGEFAASSDTIQRILRAAGHAYAEVLRNYSVDTVTDRATATLRALPGPRVVVDSIIVLGAEQVGRAAVLRQLTIGEGDLLIAEELVQSQRNLYRLEIVQFATVTIAEDTLQAVPDDSTTATVVVRIAEGPVHVVEAVVGYGTVDCFRARTEWVSRSLGGGARRLAIEGSVSKIGIGKPLDLGFGESVCGAYSGDPFARDLDYRLAAELSQPWFLSPRNQLRLSAYAERQSEPSVFQREARGGRLAVTRQLGLRSSLTAALDIERGRTVTVPALFCATFLVCEPSDIEALSRFRWKNSLGANWILDRTNQVLEPTSGFTTRVGVAWAPAWLGSEVTFVRATTEAAAYTTPRQDWVLATHLRVGSFLGTATIEPGADFLPPDERFYAGGANSVRGFARNELGPGVYVGDSPVFDPDAVDFVPIGGAAVAVASAELRTPAPFARDLLRLAWFVDAGVVSRDRIWSVDAGDVRITPGFGLRIATPIGPVRFDVAYNGYGTAPGPLFLPDPATGNLVRAQDEFDPGAGSFLDRLQFHLAVGQPF